MAPAYSLAWTLLISGESQVAGSAAPAAGALTQAAPVASQSLLLHTVFVLGVVLLIAILVVRFVLRRVVAGPVFAGGNNLRIVDRLSLEPRRSLILVRAGDHYLLLAASEAGVAFIREVPAHEVVVPLVIDGPWKTIWRRVTGTGGSDNDRGLGPSAS